MSDLRCAFTFTDGRRCRMLRHRQHPSLCLPHARREQGTDAARARAAARLAAAAQMPLALDNRAAIRRAIRRVYHLTAEQRITPQRAALLANLARLLLISAPRPRRRHPRPS